MKYDITEVQKAMSFLLHIQIEPKSWCANTLSTLSKRLQVWKPKESWYWQDQCKIEQELDYCSQNQNCNVLMSKMSVKLKVNCKTFRIVMFDSVGLKSYNRMPKVQKFAQIPQE